MKNKSILFVIISSIFTAIAQLVFKISMKESTLLESISTLYLWLGLLSYGIATILFMISLRSRELSKTFPAISLSLVWIYLISYFAFNEKITYKIMLGFLFLIIGNWVILKK